MGGDGPYFSRGEWVWLNPKTGRFETTKLKTENKPKKDWTKIEAYRPDLKKKCA